MDECLAPQLPVLLPDVTAGWGARAWTWESLVESFGEIPIDVCEGRTRAARPDHDYRPLVVSRPFGEVVACILDPATGNDVYVTANNKALEGPLAGMLRDVGEAPSYLDPARNAVSSIWMGPAGARTPLHHDTSSILLCQFLGRKRIRLAPPEEIEIADLGEGFWGGVDLDDPAALEAAGLADMAVREVVVCPGETLLIPSGWWHQVLSVEPGISLTFAGLWSANEYRWYAPGARGPAPSA